MVPTSPDLRITRDQLDLVQHSRSRHHDFFCYQPGRNSLEEIHRRGCMSKLLRLACSNTSARPSPIAVRCSRHLHRLSSMDQSHRTFGLDCLSTPKRLTSTANSLLEPIQVLTVERHTLPTAQLVPAVGEVEGILLCPYTLPHKIIHARRFYFVVSFVGYFYWKDSDVEHFWSPVSVAGLSWQSRGVERRPTLHSFDVW